MSDDHEDEGSGAAGEALEAVEHALEAATGLAGETEAGEVLHAAAEAASTLNAARGAVEGVVGVARSLQRGEAGGALSNAARGASGAMDASRHVLDNAEARRAMQEASSAARTGQQLYDQGRSVAEGMASGGSANDDVEYHLEVESFEARWGVQHMDAHEALNEPFQLTVHALVTDAHPEARDLLGKDCSLRVERRSQQRTLKGFVQHARVRPSIEHGTRVELRIAPRLWLLGRNQDTRIYQDKTVPEIVQELYQRLLSSTGRQVRTELTATYPRHEYLTQYQESDLAFMTRLCEQEGVFFYFDHEANDHETLVLADHASGLALVRDDGRVPFAEDPHQAPEDEAVFDAEHEDSIGATDAVHGEYDWTHPQVAVRGERTGLGEGEPAIQVYDHTEAVALHDYDAGSRGYRANDAAARARRRTEELRLRRERWSLQSTVVSAQPGRVIELTGCPDGSLDGRDLIVSSSARGQATEGRSGAYSNALHCVPVDVPFRPPKLHRRPVVAGPETAIVVGPAGEEIHTDDHGRIKVQFHWDRQGQRNERSSCWLRVSQMWGGDADLDLARSGASRSTAIDCAEPLF
ncbi:MAG: type VI secretion system tip protein VgrG [Sandaracinaceae bacterium]|nr:type VI secretion system tip protein VgrG [Sandaracinaceae bacterium]